MPPGQQFCLCASKEPETTADLSRDTTEVRQNTELGRGPEANQGHTEAWGAVFTPVDGGTEVQGVSLWTTRTSGSLLNYVNSRDTLLRGGGQAQDSHI